MQAQPIYNASVTELRRLPAVPGQLRTLTSEVHTGALGALYAPKPPRSRKSPRGFGPP